MGVARGCTAQAGNEIRIDNSLRYGLDSMRGIMNVRFGKTRAIQLHQLVISALLVILDLCQCLKILQFTLQANFHPNPMEDAFYAKWQAHRETTDPKEVVAFRVCIFSVSDG